jgi:hypothetical protein
MSPILGIIASSFRSAAGPKGAYDALATVTVPSGGLASITFAAIPNTYKHLQIRYTGYSTRTNLPLDTYEFRAGTGSIDTTASYSYHNLYGDGTSAGATAAASATTIQPVFCVGTLFTSNPKSGAGVIDLLDYANTSKFKTMRFLGGFDNNGTQGSGTQYGGRIGLTSGLWQKTTAIDTLTMFPTNGSWGQDTQITLYGIR